MIFFSGIVPLSKLFCVFIMHTLPFYNVKDCKMKRGRGIYVKFLTFSFINSYCHILDLYGECMHVQCTLFSLICFLYLSRFSSNKFGWKVICFINVENDHLENWLFPIYQGTGFRWNTCNNFLSGYRRFHYLTLLTLELLSSY